MALGFGYSMIRCPCTPFSSYFRGTIFLKFHTESCAERSISRKAFCNDIEPDSLKQLMKFIRA